MNGARKPCPVGVCKVCGGVTYRLGFVNQRCGRGPQGRRCKGIFANASRAVDWKECLSCAGTGRLDATACPYCRGIGWLLARPWGL